MTAERYEQFRQSWAATPEKVDRAVRAAVEVANPSRVFVFGSWARGQSGMDSDLDLAVFVPDQRKDEMESLRRKIRQTFDDIPMSIDLIIASEGYVGEFLSSTNSLYYKIVHDGMLVYDGAN